MGQTVSSQTTNESTIQVPFRDPVEEYILMDLPGHPKLSYLYEEEIKNRLHHSLRGIIYVVDSASGSKGIAKAAQGLYKILQLVEVKAGGIDILVAANKSDVFNAMSASRLTTMLEQEIDNLRESSKRGLGEVKTHGEEEDIWVGSEGNIKFSQLESHVAVREGSVTFDKVAKWEEWIEMVVANSN